MFEYSNSGGMLSDSSNNALAWGITNGISCDVSNNSYRWHIGLSKDGLPIFLESGRNYT